MNNKGFAITTILYGTLILFILLFFSLLGILSQYKSNLEKLVESTNGARGIVTLKKVNRTLDECKENSEEECEYVKKSNENVSKRGYYNIDGKCYRYLTIGETATCEK